MMKIITVVALLGTLLLAGCGEEQASKALMAQGFKDVALDGHPWWGCGHDDSFFWNQNFTGTSIATGARVSGTACGGWLKGYTVRIDRVL